MKYKIFATAKRQLINIRQHSEKNWGKGQADKYIYELYESFNKIASAPELWKKPEYEKLKNVFYYKYKKHFIFFRKLSKDSLGIISILHERMNLPDRLKDDL